MTGSDVACGCVVGGDVAAVFAADSDGSTAGSVLAGTAESEGAGASEVSSVIPFSVSQPTHFKLRIGSSLES